jgi:predicted nuclease of predicted toxin-antitoxin system
LVSEAVRYYLDEHVDPAVAHALRRLGIDVLTTAEAGRLSDDDSAQLAFATTEGRVMVTFDRDYLDRHSVGTPHAGIAFAWPTRRSIGYLVQALELIHGVYTADDMLCRLEYL